MLRGSERLVSSLAHAALLGGSLLPALVYLFVGYAGMRQMAEDDAKVQAGQVSRIIAGNPEGWRYATERLVDQISGIQHGGTHTHLYDPNGTFIVERIGNDCPLLCISARSPLSDFGIVVGGLQVDIDFAPLLWRGSVIAGVGVAFGLLLMGLLNRHVLVPLKLTQIANTELAFHDPLTKLPNRRLLMDRIEQALLASTRSKAFGAILLMDLDNFKVINDTMGHDAGDRLLIEVAQRLQVCLRQEDTISRLGGDEYIVVVEGLGTDERSAANQAEMIAEKIRDILCQPYVVSHNGQKHHSTSSIGVTLYRDQELTIDVLLKQADLALYQAKAGGRNTVRFFNPEMQAAIDSLSAMEAALRNGIEQREFQLFYQPQIDQDGRVTGAEALLRWFPVNQAQVSPAKFIPIAEDTGLIVPIGLWVMQTACTQLKVWRDDPLTSELQIAVNVSASQFRQSNFVEAVRDVLQETGANPALLKLELTEGVVLSDVEQAIGRMKEIKALGVTFSLDDFGTGFSSLSYLKRLPLDQVKIDQSFVRDLSIDPNDAAIVRAIIAMTRSLGMDSIAEGVETLEQLDFLRSNGCTNYQGYLFGKPMPVQDWSDFLQRPQVTLAKNRIVEKLHAV